MESRKNLHFCSVERYVRCLRHRKELSPITKDEALRNGYTLANLYIGEKASGEQGIADEFVLIREDGIRDNFDGKYVKIELAEKISDEKYFKNVDLP